MCLTILTQSYSKSALSNGELIESDYIKYSGPSKVATLSTNDFFVSFILWIFVLRITKQNYGDQVTLINEF